MRIELTLLPCVAITIFMLSSCSGSQTAPEHEAARKLYKSSVKLIEEYTDSAANAADSAKLIRIERHLGEKLVKVNFKFPPDTDLNLTEEENDSLYILMSAFRREYDGKLKSFSQDLHPASAAIEVKTVTEFSGAEEQGL